MDIEVIMRASKVIPVIVINEPKDAIPMARALLAGGLNVLEVTLRTEHGLGAIKDIRQSLPDAIVGAGTILSSSDVENAAAAGAQFIVSPGSTSTLINKAVELQIPVLPGVSSPSEIMNLREQGIRHMKLFPAEVVGGCAMLSALQGPLGDVKFCPTGGVNLNNAKEYLALTNVLCVGGSWMLPKKLLKNKDWAAITELAKEAAALEV